MKINNYMTVNEAAYRWNIKTNTVKNKLKPSLNKQEIEMMIEKGLIKYFIEPGKKNRSWIITSEAMEYWFNKKEIKKQ